MNLVAWLLFGVLKPPPPNRPVEPPLRPASNEEKHAGAAFAAARTATTFMQSQIEGLERLQASSTQPIKIDPDAYYAFAAGVYGCCAKASEQRHGYSEAISSAALPAFMQADGGARIWVWAKLRTEPSLHGKRASAECSKWLAGQAFDTFALARSLGE